MTATPLLEFLPPDSPAFEATARALADALLIEKTALEKLDKFQYPRDPDFEARDRSERIFSAWHRWLDEADTLLRRVRQAQPSQEWPDYLRPLRTAVGFAHCTVQMTLNNVLRSREQIARGETLSGEEVIREIRSRVHARRAAEVEAA